jgi:hypothetical protein
MTHAIIICAGEATRWQNYKGVPKHLIEINGEKILERTVRLINKYSKAKVYVVGRGNDERYKIKGSAYYEADLNPDNFDADKFLSSKKLWNKNGRTIVFYGDCYFTDEAVKTIMEYKGKDWILFARYGSSQFTGCEWGECFAQSFYPKDIKRHEDALYTLADMKRRGELDTCGGWQHYRIMDGIDPKNHARGDNFYEIDDFTDDFDYPKDLDRWYEHFNRLSNSKN